MKEIKICLDNSNVWLNKIRFSATILKLIWYMNNLKFKMLKLKKNKPNNKKRLFWKTKSKLIWTIKELEFNKQSKLLRAKIFCICNHKKIKLINAHRNLFKNIRKLRIMVVNTGKKLLKCMVSIKKLKKIRKLILKLYFLQRDNLSKSNHIKIEKLLNKDVRIMKKNFRLIWSIRSEFKKLKKPLQTPI